MNKILNKKLILFLIFVATGFVLIKYTPLGEITNKEALVAFFTSLKGAWWGPVLFIALYALACVFALPGALLTWIGGAIFGVFLGSLINIFASNLGASLAFFMARYLGRDAVARFLKGGKLAELNQSIEKNGFMAIFRLRVIPAVPFNVLNYGSGLSKVKFRDYLLGSIFGMLPATLIYTYFGSALLQGVSDANRQAFINLLIAATLLVAISFIPNLYKKLKSR